MNLNVVLVRSEYSTNVGASARALANMGGGQLILIDPKCEINEQAKQMAAGAQAPLRNIKVYKDWSQFYAIEGDGCRVAFTRRSGGNRKVSAFSECIQKIKATGPSNIYLIFGPEADGLDNDDLAFVNHICHLPIFGEFASLNLAQAVLLALFMVRQQMPPQAMPPQVTGDADPSVLPFYFPDQLIRDWLTAMGFDIQARRSSAYLTLRRLFMANQPTQHELQVLESILQQNIRKLKELS